MVPVVYCESIFSFRVDFGVHRNDESQNNSRFCLQEDRISFDRGYSVDRYLLLLQAIRETVHFFRYALDSIAVEIGRAVPFHHDETERYSNFRCSNRLPSM